MTHNRLTITSMIGGAVIGAVSHLSAPEVTIIVSMIGIIPSTLAIILLRGQKAQQFDQLQSVLTELVEQGRTTASKRDE